MTEADHLQRIREAAADVDRVQQELREARERFRGALREAREAKVSLAAIGRELGVTRQRVAQLLEG